MQGAVAVPGLCGAVRSVQVYLTIKARTSFLKKRSKKTFGPFARAGVTTCGLI
jgi:hypothetical protein